ncbi:MAG: hypothetical protein AB7S48_16910 [Bacteroidales bacterium]
MIKRLFILTLLVTTLVSCKEEDNNTNYDFSVLGLEQLIINDQIVTLDSNGFPSGVFDIEDIGITGKGLCNSMQIYDLFVLKNNTDNSISIKSKFDDTVAEITKEETDDHITYIVTVTRNGFEEKVIYNISFPKQF